MRRPCPRTFLHHLKPLLIAAYFFVALRIAAIAFAGEPIRLKPGPQLFLDDFLIAEQAFLNRTVVRPQKRPDPIITGRGGDDNFQPYISILRDPATQRFRVWYNTPENMQRSHLGYLESTDGANWIRPHRVLEDPMTITFCVSVVDRGPAFMPASERYALGFNESDGLKIALSPDGLKWTMLQKTSVVKHNHDINSLHWDPIRQQYIAIVSVLEESPRWPGKRRIPYQTVSKDLRTWEEKWPIIRPKIGASIEEGETQFYSMSGLVARGDVLIGLVKVLRDDLNATGGKSADEMGDLDRKAAGIGYTVLAWTRDGRQWHRDDQPFLLNDPNPSRWDHAMAWGDAQIVDGKRTMIYFAGYQRGHKVERFTERVWGIADMPRDRYVAREADLNLGRLRTKPVVLAGSKMTVNARVAGELAVRIVEPSGASIRGFDWAEIRGDDVNHPVTWAQPLSSLGARAACLEFRLRDAQLFGFELQSDL
jgi:hypothetical protein